MQSVNSTVASGAMALAVVDFQPRGLALRLISALIMAPIAIGATIVGWPFYELMITLGCTALVWEWTRLCGRGTFTETGWALLVAVLAVVAAASLGMELEALGIIVIGTFAMYQLAISRGQPSAFWTAAGVPYLGLPSLALLWLRTDFGPYPVLWLFFCVWATDIGAYAAGRLIGGRKLAPKLSPNKTWAGLLGGIVAASVSGVIFSIAASSRSISIDSLGLFAGLSALVALVSQGGDLTESGIKRHFNVKDTSGLIPGHGGLFDRVDGLLAAAPLVALIQLLSGGGVLAWQ